MRQVDGTSEKLRVQNGIKEWCICRTIDIKNLFEQWVLADGEIVNEPSVESLAAKGAMGHENQYCRLTGIDFGLVPEDFRKEVHSIANNEGGRVTMELAIEEGVFMVYFKTTSPSKGKDVGTYWIPSLEPGEKTHLYGVAPVPHRSVTPRLGVSTDLRNQFIANWVTLPFFLVGDLFYSMLDGQQVEPRQFNRNRAWARAMRYNISGDNLTAFHELLKGDSGNKGIRLRFGANLSDVMLGEDLFTILIEVDDNYANTRGRFILNNALTEALEETTYLEYVGGCPPLC